MAAYGEAMRLVSQALHEVQHRVLQGQGKRGSARHVKSLSPGAPVWAFGDGRDRLGQDAQLVENFQRN